MLRYAVKLAPDDNGTVLVTVPDFPEVVTYGEDEADAFLRAADAIATAIQGRIGDRRAISPPSRSPGPSSNSTAQCLRPARARLIWRDGSAFIPPQVDHLLDLDHDSRLDQIEKAARAMGREFHIEMRSAA